jgi:hypothetical protein
MKIFTYPPTTPISDKVLNYYCERLENFPDIEHIAKLLKYSVALFNPQYTYPEGATKFIDTKDSLEFYTYDVSDYTAKDIQVDSHIIRLTDMTVSRKIQYHNKLTIHKQFKLDNVSFYYDMFNDCVRMNIGMADDEYYYFGLNLLGNKVLSYYLFLTEQPNNHGNHTIL